VNPGFGSRQGVHFWGWTREETCLDRRPSSRGWIDFCAISGLLLVSSVVDTVAGKRESLSRIVSRRSVCRSLPEFWGLGIRVSGSLGGGWNAFREIRKLGERERDRAIGWQRADSKMLPVHMISIRSDRGEEWGRGEGNVFCLDLEYLVD
jgi:hypothetical protein